MKIQAPIAAIVLACGITPAGAGDTVESTILDLETQWSAANVHKDIPTLGADHG
jgi:hypothetical protein